MITQKDIALEAGVSVMTVSNVINHKHANVSQETIERVNEIIKKYNYSPNQYARNLSQKTTNTIVIFAPSHSDKPYNIFLDPYNQNMIGYMEMYLREKNYAVMIQLCHTPRAVIQSLHTWNVAGAIFFYPYFNHDEMKQIVDTGIPIVVIDRYYPNLDLLTVDLDDYGSAYLATEFLISHGHQKIAFATPGTLMEEDSSVVFYRYQGYVDALKKHQIPPQENWIFCDCFDYETGILVGQKIMRMKENTPTAVVCCTDRIAAGVLEGVRLSGKRVPMDLSVVAFDDGPITEYAVPKITTINQNFEQKSLVIVDLLLKAINKQPIENPHITQDVNLIDRQSVLDIS